MGYIYLAVVIFLVALGGTVAWKYNHALEAAVAAEQRAAVAEQGIKEYEASYKLLQAKNKQLDDSLKRKVQNDSKLRREIAVLQGRLEDLRQSDPVVKAWSDELVPEPIVKLLRNDAPAPGKTDGGDSGPQGADGFDSGPNGGGITIRVQ